MKAVWMVRSRELARRIRFWTTIVGYDPRERSLSQSIYLIYVVFFFSIWGFTMLALLADQGAKILSLFHGSPPSQVSIIILLIIVLIIVTIIGYNSVKRSPFIFSETDAELICQTPANRRQVALTWFIGERSTEGMIFVALGVIFRFASLELLVHEQVLWSDLPSYFLAGLQVASITIPLYIAVIAIDYALGALRLRGDNDIPWLRWIPIGLGATIFILAIYDKSILSVFLWPLLIPLKAGFSEVHWLGGFTVAMTLAFIGLLALYTSSSRLNLSRAAQESRFRWAVQQVSWSGDTHLKREVLTREKLGSGHQASRIPGRIGAGALIWKDWVESLRVINIGDLIGWLGVFGLFLGLLLEPVWGTRLWAFILSCLLIGQRCTDRLRSDLRVWVITRQLAIQSDALLLAELVSPVFLTTLMAWIAMLVSHWLGYYHRISLVLLIPILVLCLALIAAFDILRHCRSSELLAGHVAELGVGGVVLGVILTGIITTLFYWLTFLPAEPVINCLITFLGLSFCGGMTYLILRLTTWSLNQIK
jgi:hypothetical protein